MATPIDKLVIQIRLIPSNYKELNQIEGKLKTTGAAGGAAFGMGFRWFRWFMAKLKVLLL
jgi:hypothetical protein